MSVCIYFAHLYMKILHYKETCKANVIRVPYTGAQVAICKLLILASTKYTHCFSNCSIVCFQIFIFKCSWVEERFQDPAAENN